MERTIWYSVRSGGDGSAYPFFFESKELAEIDQDFLDEGWGETCTGSITLQSDSPITVVDELITKEMVIDEIEEELKDTYSYDSEYKIKELKRKLKEVQAI